MTNTDVSSLSYNELAVAVRREGEGIVASGRLGLDVPVPTCGEWTMRDLLLHVGRIYSFAGGLLAERITAAPEGRPKPPEGIDPVDYIADALETLVDALAGCSPDTPVWNWSNQPDLAAFWARRMAHESAIHRYDAQRAHDVAQPVDADLAHDGFGELIDVLLPGILMRNKVTDGPTATYAFAAADDGAWAVRFDGDHISRAETAKNADVTVQGTSSALLLAVYNRIKWRSLQIEGNADLLDAWSAAIKF